MSAFGSISGTGERLIPIAPLAMPNLSPSSPSYPRRNSRGSSDSNYHRDTRATSQPRMRQNHSPIPNYKAHRHVVQEVFSHNRIFSSLNGASVLQNDPVPLRLEPSIKTTTKSKAFILGRVDGGVFDSDSSCEEDENKIGYSSIKHLEDSSLQQKSHKFRLKLGQENLGQIKFEQPRHDGSKLIRREAQLHGQERNSSNPCFVAIRAQPRSSIRIKQEAGDGSEDDIEGFEDELQDTNMTRPCRETEDEKQNREKTEKRQAKKKRHEHPLGTVFKTAVPDNFEPRWEAPPSPSPEKSALVPRSKRTTCGKSVRKAQGFDERPRKRPRTTSKTHVAAKQSAVPLPANFVEAMSRQTANPADHYAVGNTSTTTKPGLQGKRRESSARLNLKNVAAPSAVAETAQTLCVIAPQQATKHSNSINSRASRSKRASAPASRVSVTPVPVPVVPAPNKVGELTNRNLAEKK